MSWIAPTKSWIAPTNFFFVDEIHAAKPMMAGLTYRPFGANAGSGLVVHSFASNLLTEVPGQRAVKRQRTRNRSPGTEVGPMKKIRSMTLVQAPVELCFRLALSIDLHRDATGDVPLAGRT